MRTMFFLGIALLAASVFGADLTGKWVAQTQNRNGGTSNVTFDLKYDGTTLTGTVTMPGGRGGRRGGGAAATPTPIDISDAKFDGTNVSFSVKREFNGQTMVTTYTGTFTGDDLKLKETRQGRNGEQTVNLDAKRSGS